MALSLVHLKGNTFYIPSPTNVGIYVNNGNAILIDSGNDKEAGRQILKLLKEQGWNLKLIINTHSNADHVGGNQFLQDKTNCDILSTRIESAFITDPILEASFLYGGLPFKDLNNKFLMAKPSAVTNIIPSDGEIFNTGLKTISLPGHYFDMIGVLTPDDVFFVGDSVFPENIIKKYHIYYILDVKAHLKTLEKLNNFNAEMFVPSHGEPIKDIKDLVELNKNEVLGIASKIQNICSEGKTIEEILENICDIYDISLDANQYVLLSSTIRSYITYLYEEGSIRPIFNKNKLLWEKA
ncbi:Hydroxyacylglutathione hydrolase [Caloramator mitchellensis]|uniref:Hydroxyacylglutathione hydrolase n=1 Tax=Caloramator mitchellensis TaxID=908809 RepID=A0A0R3JTE8_CALMK|nr:MBL fold metallo-hydrolase [Caloramator mitchellensis]KRQ86282.1 Hydroxyacylglutathione hydrolase [Caloramator mitchellensis]